MSPACKMHYNFYNKSVFEKSAKFLIFLTFITITNPFNVEWRYPIIIRNIGGPKSSNYFGASVALLKADYGAAWVIIGAPKSNSTLAVESDIFEPGVIWQCSLGPEQERCKQLSMDPTPNIGTGPTEYWRDEGWLGGPGAMAQDSNGFIACASRWEKRWNTSDGITNAYMHGICYRRPRADLFKDPMPPLQMNRYRLNPLEEPEIEKKKFWKHGQAGFSVHMPKTGNEIIMGAPGIEQWRGSLIQYLSRDGGDTFSKSFIAEPLRNADSIYPFNYLGYSLTSGFFMEMRSQSASQNLHRALVQYAAGAPRGNGLTGKVVIFRFPNDPGNPLQILTELIGDQTGSYFGASMLALDVNGDGYDDLLVAAPRFSRDQGSRLKDKLPLRSRGGTSGMGMEARFANYDRFGGYGDEGAVFLYLSNGIALSRQQKVLNGGNRPWAQFGTAMTSLGDLNRDGYNDFAISAPYESLSAAAQGTGAIYIYHGSETGLITSAAQVIRASEVDNSLRGFGFSLASNEDVDNNGFNDIAIGSFNSSQTVILRSKPVITVFGRIKSNQNKLPLNIEAFQIESCVSFTGDYTPVNVNLVVRLSSDYKSRPQRVTMQFASNPDKISSPIIEYNVTVSKDKETCTSIDARVIEPLETSGDPVTFQQIISIPSELGFGVVKKRIVDIHPDGSYSISGEAYASFCKTCPIINTAKPSRNELQLPLAVSCGDDDKCEADLRLEVNFRDIPDSGYVIGSSPSIFMDVELTNYRETAIAPAVLISWKKLNLKRMPPDCSPSPSNSIGNIVTFRCTLGKLLEENEVAKVSLEFDVSTLKVQEMQVEYELVFNVNATTASEMIHPASETIILPLTASADVYIGGSKYLEIFNMETLSPFLVFKHIYEVNLDGPSPVGNVEVVFDLPVNLTTSTGAVVNVRAATVDQSQGEMICQPTKGHFAKSELVVIPTSQEEEDDPDFDAAGIGGFLPKDKDYAKESNASLVENDRLLIHCDSPWVVCMEVTCKTDVFTPVTTSLISFVFDMEAETIRQLFQIHQVSNIQIESKGRLILPEVVRDIQPQQNRPDENVAITVIEREGYKPVSKWIFILAVVIGVLVLLCVIFCLYACGCFESTKKRPDDGDDPAHGAAEEEMMPLQEKPEASDDLKNGDLEAHREAVESSPSIDITEPPEFVPKNPPIPEESEEEEDDIKVNEESNVES